MKPVAAFGGLSEASGASMRVGLSCVCAAASLLLLAAEPAPEAAPDAAFALMNDYCLGSHADPATVEARLKADGWQTVEIPAALVGGINDLQLKRVFVRERPGDLKTGEGGSSLLMFGDGTMPTGQATPTRVKMCMAGVLPATGDVRRVMQAEFEQKPGLKQGELWVWAYQDRSGFRQFLPDFRDATLRRAVREGDLSFVFAGYDREMEMAGYAVAIDLKPPVP